MLPFAPHQILSIYISTNTAHMIPFNPFYSLNAFIEMDARFLSTNYTSHEIECATVEFVYFLMFIYYLCKLVWRWIFRVKTISHTYLPKGRCCFWHFAQTHTLTHAHRDRQRDREEGRRMGREEREREEKENGRNQLFLRKNQRFQR